MAVSDTPPVGYSLSLPPEWHRIPLRAKTKECLDEIILSSMGTVPRNVPRDDAINFRMSVRREMLKLVEQAQDAGGIDLYLPVSGHGLKPLAASFLVLELSLEDETVRPQEILAKIGGEFGEHKTCELDGTLALRREDPSRGSTGSDNPDGSLRVDYIAAVPEDPTRWLIITFSMLGSGVLENEYLDALVDLFDSIMTTFRWKYVE